MKRMVGQAAAVARVLQTAAQVDQVATEAGTVAVAVVVEREAHRATAATAVLESAL